MFSQIELDISLEMEFTPFDSNIVPVGHAMYEFECAVYICSFEKRQKSCHGSSALFHLFLAELSRSSSLKST